VMGAMFKRGTCNADAIRDVCPNAPQKD